MHEAREHDGAHRWRRPRRRPGRSRTARARAASGTRGRTDPRADHRSGWPARRRSTAPTPPIRRAGSPPMSSTAAGSAVAAPNSSKATALMMRHTPIVKRPRPAPNNDAELDAVVAGVALVAVISVRSRSGSVPTAGHHSGGPRRVPAHGCWISCRRRIAPAFACRARPRWCCSSHSRAAACGFVGAERPAAVPPAHALGPVVHRREWPGRDAARRQLRARSRRRSTRPRPASATTTPRCSKPRGFNTVRLGSRVRGADARTRKGRPRYIDHLAETVRVLGRHGIYVLLDFHQDGWGPLTHGNGMPAWATLTDGAAEPERRVPRATT